MGSSPMREVLFPLHKVSIFFQEQLFTSQMCAAARTFEMGAAVRARLPFHVLIKNNNEHQWVRNIISGKQLAVTCKMITKHIST